MSAIEAVMAELRGKREQIDAALASLAKIKEMLGGPFDDLRPRPVIPPSTKVKRAFKALMQTQALPPIPKTEAVTVKANSKGETVRRQVLDYIAQGGQAWFSRRNMAAGANLPDKVAGHHLRQLVAAGALEATGTTGDRRYRSSRALNSAYKQAPGPAKAGTPHTPGKSSTGNKPAKAAVGPQTEVARQIRAVITECWADGKTEFAREDAQKAVAAHWQDWNPAQHAAALVTALREMVAAGELLRRGFGPGETYRTAAPWGD